MPARLRSPKAKPNARVRVRRGRPPKIDGEHLLSVARGVFLERGIRATTLEVAESAGVSEGALFHRFKTKEGLFRAAMEFPAEDAPRQLMKAVDQLEGLELEEALPRLVSALLEIGRVAIPLMMMSWSNPSACGAHPQDAQGASYHSFVKRVAAFFETQMKAGRLRALDAELLARVFLGSIHHYCMTRIIAGERVETMSERRFARGLVDLILNGSAEAPAVPRERRRAALHR